MAKLKTTNKWKANQTNILPLVGKVKFDDNAEIEVDDNIVEKLIQVLPEFSLSDDSLEKDKGEDIKEKTEDQGELGEEGGEDIKPQVEDFNEDDVRKKLNDLSVKEIKESYLNQFPEEDVKELKNKSQYIDYIIEQLKK